MQTEFKNGDLVYVLSRYDDKIHCIFAKINTQGKAYMHRIDNGKDVRRYPKDVFLTSESEKSIILDEFFNENPILFQKLNLSEFENRINNKERALELEISNKHTSGRISSEFPDGSFSLKYHENIKSQEEAIELKGELLGVKRLKLSTMSKSKELGFMHKIDVRELEISIINDNLTLYGLLELVQKLPSLKKDLLSTRKKLNKLKLSNQQDLALDCDSICTWGKYKGEVLEDIPSDWLFDLAYEYAGAEPNCPELKRLLNYIEDYGDIISER